MRDSRSRRFALAALVVSAAPFLIGWSFFGPFHEQVKEGNRKVREGQQADALPHFEEASKLNPASPVPDFNRGIALSREGRDEEARDAFLAAAASEDPQVAADALYNLGNVFLDTNELPQAVEAYLQSLDLDPQDEDARRNLEIAFRRLEEQQQQPQQDPENSEQNEDEPNEDEEQKRDPSEGEDEQQQQENQPEDGEEPEEPQGGEDSQPQDGEEQEPPSEPLPPEERLTREDAERLLNAIESDELKVLQELQESDEDAKGVVTNDW